MPNVSTLSITSAMITEANVSRCLEIYLPNDFMDSRPCLKLIAQSLNGDE